MPTAFFPLRPLAALVVAFLPASPVGAADQAELFKCVDAAGAISIQSGPCAKGSTQVWRRAAEAEPAPTAEQAAQAQARRARDEQAVRDLSEEVERRLRPDPPTPASAPAPEASPTAAQPAAAQGPDRCERAQDFSRDLRDKPWLALSEDQTRRLHAWVAAECQAVGRED